MEFKINHTNNLSAARYFSSFGIQNFGFNLDTLNPNHVSIYEAKQIIGWLYQPNVILEIGIFQTLEEIDFLKEEIGFSSIEINIHHAEFDRIIEKYRQSWIKMNLEEFEDFNFEEERFRDCVFIVEVSKIGSVQINKILAQSNLIFLDIKNDLNIEEVTKLLDNLNLCINCQKETAVGKFDIEPYEKIIYYLGED